MIKRILNKLHILLKERGLTISAAESCTGGWIAKLMTDTPGSSKYFLGGVVAYSNEVKTKALGIPADLLEKFGAVSEETCRAMCLGVRNLTASDVAVSVTGIAGPDGGSPEKPVGTVYAGFCVGEDVFVKLFHFAGNRNAIREKTCRGTLSYLLSLLKETPNA